MTAEVELAALVAGFPDHQTLGRALQDGVNATVVRLQTERGEVHTPEDVFATVRWMQTTKEKLEAYGRAFAGAAKLIDTYAVDELLDAVGEQDGVPIRNLTVPAADGDILLTRDQGNDYDIDVTSVMAAVAFEVTGGQTDQTWLDTANLCIAAMERLLTLGRFAAQVTKIRAFAAELARAGHDGLASTLTTAIRKTTAYRGVKMDRKKPS